MEGVDFKGSLKILAERAGVELVPEDPKKRDERETQYALIEEAAQFFFKAREEQPETTKYVTDRGVTGETIHAWRIGYAPDEWRALRAHLHTKKYTDEQIKKAGLIKTSEGGKEPYDVFRDRIMFPICDASGRVVAFSGRTLKQDVAVPKYVNSPETELFQKSDILYGYDKAKQGIRRHDFSLIVEGQFDVVLAHQAGYTNTVAVSGTAFTEHHLELLQRLSNRSVLALDADKAGIAAVKRSSEMMLPRGMDVKVAEIPEGADPADIIKEDANQFKHIIGEAKHVIEFLLAVLKHHIQDERTYKLRTRDAIVPLIAQIPNRIDRDHFVGVVAAAIGTTHDAMHYELTRIESETETPVETTAESQESVAASAAQKQDLITHLFAMTLVADGAAKLCVTKLEAALQQLLGVEKIATSPDVLQESLSKHTFMAEEYLEKTHPRQVAGELESKLNYLVRLLAKERLTNLRQEIKRAEEQDESDTVMELLKATKEAETLLQTHISLGDGEEVET